MKCTNCGTEYQGNACPNCGTVSEIQNYSQQPNYQQPNYQPQQAPQQPYYQQAPQGQQGGIRCPKCGSTNLQIINEVKGKGVSFLKLCLCGLFGLCGAGKTKNKQFWVCQNCGNKFKA